MLCFVNTLTAIRELWLCTCIYGQNLEDIRYFCSFFVSFDVYLALRISHL